MIRTKCNGTHIYKELKFKYRKRDADITCDIDFSKGTEFLKDWRCTLKEFYDKKVKINAEYVMDGRGTFLFDLFGEENGKP